ncbi:hypothetical protein [Chitinibacter tainanensis]|uniref:hypothetical protein n=1 Tax=Chitinibacter tainanensis TaxID=230667 RepID=UPI00041F0068|nr:hypothetical protein [Chitinibacter tainanensis]
MQIRSLTPTYSTIQPRSMSSGLPTTTQSEAHSLWQEDLYSSSPDLPALSKPELPSAAKPVLLELAKADHVNRLVDIYLQSSGQAPLSRQSTLSAQQQRDWLQQTYQPELAAPSQLSVSA